MAKSNVDKTCLDQSIPSTFSLSSYAFLRYKSIGLIDDSLVEKEKKKIIYVST